MILIQLLLSFLQVGLFSFGGGYAAIKLIESQVVAAHNWITPEVFADLVTIAEMTPGPIAINAATFVGLRVAGIPGAILATLGCILPSVVISCALARLYLKFRNNGALGDVLSCLRPAVVALITSAFLLIFKLVAFENGAPALANLDLPRLGLFAFALVLLARFKRNPILVMLACGAINLAGGILIKIFS